MRSTSCVEAILLACVIVGVASEDHVFPFKNPLVRRHLHNKSSSSESKKKSSSSSDKSKSSSSESKTKSSSSSDKSSASSSSSSSSKTKPSSPSGSKKSKPSPESSKSDSSSKSNKSKPSGESSKSDSASKSKMSKPNSEPSKSKPSSSSPSKSKPSSPSSSKKGKGKGGMGKGTKGKGKGKGKKDKKSFAYENEPCGEDVNGGCYSDPPKYGNIDFHQTLIGEFGAILDPDSQLYERDTDWYLFDIHEPGCVQATLASIYLGFVVLFEGSTFETQTCLDNLVDVASGDSFGVPAVYCFPKAGTYGVFVAPEFADDTPCEGQPLTYYLALEHVECGTCLNESSDAGCSDKKCKQKVCRHERSCCDESWGALCVEKAREVCDCTYVDKIVEEDEPCGEDTNGGCDSNPPMFGSIEFGQTVIGEYGGVLDSTEMYQPDSDWFLFDIKGSGACVRATLSSIYDGIVILFEGSTTGSDKCEDIVDVASGDNDGNPAVYCFSKPGVYGAFVAPEFSNIEPCDGDPKEYILALEHLDDCGTCLLENSSPGCVNKECEKTVCDLDGSCCDDIWDGTCVEQAKLWCECAGGMTPNVINEDEVCGENINGGCFQDPPAYGGMELGQTLIGEYGAVPIPNLDIYRLDTDWFLFDIAEPGTCVEAILTSRDSGDVILFEGSTFDSNTCEESLVNVASGENNKDPAIYCFAEAGEYGVFVAPTHEQESPCEGDPNTYALTLKGLECGTCFVESNDPGCSDKKCTKKVCEYDSSCCDDAWDATCVEKAKLWCGNCKNVDKPSSSSSDSKSRSSSSGKGKGGKGKGDSDSKSRSSPSGKGKGGKGKSDSSPSSSSSESKSRSSSSGKGKGGKGNSASGPSSSSSDRKRSSPSGKGKGTASSMSQSSDSGKGSVSRSSSSSSEDKSKSSSSSSGSRSSKSSKSSKSSSKGKSSRTKTSKSSKRSKYKRSKRSKSR